jgi:hypothetical protein
VSEDMGASADADRAVVNGAGQAVSALRASVPSADHLFFADPHCTHPLWLRHGGRTVCFDCGKERGYD